MYADRVAFVSLGSLGYSDRKRQYILNVPDTGGKHDGTIWNGSDITAFAAVTRGWLHCGHS
ncbi:MAG: hypothetical protein ACREV4_07725 [Gammaproteobacteria bacterium]